MSQGLILVTGPTGSGKTTTIHTGLAHVNRPEVNIVTLEDPVEVTIPGVTHVGIHPQAGLGYAQILRSILRQDPDIIFVGEIREEEVANIAMRAALTGHLVLSTVHTTSAIETVVRMEDLGVPAYLLASALVLVIAQRLVRSVCKECAEPYIPNEEELAVLGLDETVLVGANMRKGTGCTKCGGTGYFGRVGVYEFMRMSPEVRRLVRTKASPEQMLNTAKEQEMINLMESGILKLRRGLTTADELIRVLYREG
jgi:type IV pilus assembly protein PilB